MIDFKMREYIRECYVNYSKDLESGISHSPYDLGIDWINLFSPIEDNVWRQIRFLGLPFYPQYPVSRYFLDFGDPDAKLGIEVDSREFHRNRQEQDKKRQSEIEKLGWCILRIPAYKTYKILDDFHDENGRIPSEAWESYLTDSSEGMIRAFYVDHGRKGTSEGWQCEILH